MGPQPSAGRIVALLLAAPVAVAAALALAADPAAIEAERPLVSRANGYVGSESCRVCHPDQHASWKRTYHRSMTQLPTRDAVLGRFDGRALVFDGRVITPVEREGRRFLRIALDGGGSREAEVALCVGSHRYQQYFELERGGRYRRLPILWHVAEARWMPVNGVFLEPDGVAADAHASLWNANCIFCHNSGPEPRLADATRVDSDASSRAGELGIACEACHGPGALHAERMHSPLARYAAEHGDRDELGIVHPAELEQRASLALCGQCHSQRVPKSEESLRAFLDAGPSFRPGDRLEAHVELVTRDTPSLDPANPELFRARFWRDGTARLTAYEYLGAVQSPCAADPRFTCLACHAMHAGDPAGQIDPDRAGDALCTQCHALDAGAHSHHDPASSGARCVACHMPPIVYGLLDVHPSHRIESPDVRRDLEAGRPNACTGCHADRTASWAADAMRAWWGERYERPRSRPEGAPLDAPAALASLFAGDPVERAVAAFQIGGAESAVAPRASAELAASLIVTLGDGYASVRALARRSLLSLDARAELGLRERIASFDPFGPAEERRERVLALLEAFRSAAAGPLDPPPRGSFVAPDFRVDLERVRALLELQDGRAVSIGE